MRLFWESDPHPRTQKCEQLYLGPAMKGTWVWIYVQTLRLIWWRKMKPVPSTPAGRAGDFGKEIFLFVLSLCVVGFEMKVWVHAVPTEDELLPSGMSWERRVMINKTRRGTTRQKCLVRTGTLQPFLQGEDLPTHHLSGAEVQKATPWPLQCVLVCLVGILLRDY